VNCPNCNSLINEKLVSMCPICCSYFTGLDFKKWNDIKMGNLENLKNDVIRSLNNGEYIFLINEDNYVLDQILLIENSLKLKKDITDII
jgi:hypothetical protein